jgi:hypothetical protein
MAVYSFSVNLRLFKRITVYLNPGKQKVEKAADKAA